MSSSPVRAEVKGGKMTAPKSVRRESTARQALIQATAQIMLEEGYAAATSRRVAAKAGVKPALVHYYFPSMDELFLAVLRAGAEINLQRQRQRDRRRAVTCTVAAQQRPGRPAVDGIHGAGQSPQVDPQ